LEDELGAPLLEKTGSGSQLTEFGNKILPIAESMIAKYDEYANLIFSLAAQNRGTITISLENKLFLFALPTDLTSSYGELKINFLIAGNYAKCAEDVLRGRADLGLFGGTHDGSTLECIPFLREPITIIMRSDHYLAKKSRISISDLQGVAQIRLDTSDKINANFINACIKEGFYPNYVLESADLELILRTILTRNAVAPIASFALTEFSSDKLVGRPLIHDTAKVEVSFLTNETAKKKALVQSYINAVLSYYS
jgi:DNA-binding transcriptional LysR family regulator